MTGPHRTRRWLLLLLLFTALACDQVTRSGYRKVGAYFPQRLLELDVASMRVALLHDERIQILPDSDANFSASFAGDTAESYRFSPRVISESPSIPGLPPAGKGLIWTVLSLRDEDVSLARPLGYIFLLNDLRDSLKNDKRVAAPAQRSATRLSPAASADFAAAVSRVLPRTAASQFGPAYSGPEPRIELQFNLALARARPLTRTSLEVWPLLDPKDGYFQLTEGWIEVEGSPIRDIGRGRPGFGINFRELEAMDPGEFRLAIEHDRRIAVDLEETGLVVWATKEGKRATKLLRISGVVVRPATLRSPAPPPARKGLQWTFLAVRKEDIEPFRRILRLFPRLFSTLGIFDEGNKVAWKAMTDEQQANQVRPLLENALPKAPRLAVDEVLASDGSLDVSAPICLTAPSELAGASMAGSVWLLVDPKYGFWEFVGGTLDFEDGHACSDLL